MGPETSLSMETISGRPGTPPKPENSQTPETETPTGGLFDKDEIAKTYEGLSVNKEEGAQAQQSGQEILQKVSKEQKDIQSREKHNVFQLDMEKRGGVQLKSIKPSEQKVPEVISEKPEPYISTVEKTTGITTQKPEFSKVPVPVLKQEKAHNSDGRTVNDFKADEIPEKAEEGLKFENGKNTSPISREPRVLSRIKEKPPQSINIKDKISEPIQQVSKEQNPDMVEKQDVKSDVENATDIYNSPEAVKQREEWAQQDKQKEIPQPIDTETKISKPIDLVPEEPILDKAEKPNIKSNVEIATDIYNSLEAVKQREEWEQQEKQIEKDKEISIKSLEGKLIKTGFLNLETAHKLVINILSGEKDPWGKAKGDFSQEQWNKAQDMLKSRVGKVIEDIQQYDSLNINHLKTDTKLFGKYIDNLEQSLKSSEYASLPITALQTELADIKGLMELNATNLKQWRSKNKGVRGLINAFKLGIANLINDPEGKIKKSIDAEDQKLLQSFKDSNDELAKKLSALKKQLEGDIEAIPENIAPKEEKAPIKNEVSEPLSNSTAPENTGNPELNTRLEKERQEDLEKIKTLLVDTTKSNGRIENHNFYASGESGTQENVSNALEELKTLASKYPDIKEIEFPGKKINLNNEIVTIQSDLAFSRGFEAAQKQVKPETVVPSVTATSEKPVTAPTPTQEKKRLFARRSPLPAPEQTPQEIIKPKLSPELRGKLDSLIKDNTPDPADPVRNNTKLEKLMEIAGDKNSPIEYKDMATMQMLNFPGITLNNLEFDTPVGASEEDRKKALAEKIDIISQKYLSAENDPLSLSVEKLATSIEQKYDLKPKDIEAMPTPENPVAPQGAAVPNAPETSSPSISQ